MESVRGKRRSSEHNAELCTAKGQGPVVVTNQPTGQVPGRRRTRQRDSTPANTLSLAVNIYLKNRDFIFGRSVQKRNKTSTKSK